MRTHTYTHACIHTNAYVNIYAYAHMLTYTPYKNPILQPPERHIHCTNLPCMYIYI